MKNKPQKSAWTPDHQNLLDALHAERTLPHFCRRISLEFTTIDRQQARNWKEWSHLLRNDPGWPHIEPVLELPDAWPQIWHSVSPHGWSPLTDNYNGQFFANVFQEALTAQNLTTAHYAFQEAILAWNRAFLSSTILLYTTAHPINALLRQPPFHDPTPLFQLENSPPESAQTQLAKFTWQALQFATSTPLSNPLQPFSNQAQTQITTILNDVLSNFTQHINTLDLATATPEQIHQPFLQINNFYNIIAPTHQPLQTPFLHTIIQTTLNLHLKLSPEPRAPNSELLQPIIKFVKPLNDTLFSHLLTTNTETPDAHQTCADFIILEGDQQNTATQRLPYYEQALQTCPTHPAAKTRAAQACLERANTLLLATAAIPGFAANIPGGNLLRTRVEQARDLYFYALSLDPTHELLETYRTEITLECERFDIPFHPEKQP